MQRIKTIGVAVILVLAGLCVGIAIGFSIGSTTVPDRRASMGVPTLEPQAQEELIVFTANTYLLDRDLDRAQERLNRLRDPRILERIVRLAQVYAAKQDPVAERLALLADDLGATSPEIAILAHPATPTLAATATLIPTDTPVATPSTMPTLTTTPSRTAAPRATATRTIAPVAAAVPPQWIPGFPAGWPGGVRYEPVNVAVGQKYWRIAKTIYCDTNDEHDYCQDLPGGPLGTDTYITLLAEGGQRTGGAIRVFDGNGATYEMQEKSQDDSCNCNYSYQSNGFTVQVAGAPSDKISGMALYSVKARLANFHVRYFVTFQLTTR